MKRIERDLMLVDLFFIPSSFIRLKSQIEHDEKKKISDIWYLPLTLMEIGRIDIYYQILKNYIN